MKFSFIVFSFAVFSILLIPGVFSWSCDPDGSTQPCGSGACVGTQTCVGGLWGDCNSTGNECSRTTYCDSGCDGHANYATCTAGSCGSETNIDNSDDAECEGNTCGNCMNSGCGDILNMFYGVPTLSYKFYDLQSGNLLCDNNGACSTNNCNYDGGICADDNLTDQYPWASCHAGCDENSDCNDNIACTTDTCNSLTCGCEHIPNNAVCNDGLWCNGQETCNLQSGCQAGTPIECSQYNILGIFQCDYAPDNNPLTWDYRDAFTSTCNEDNDYCRTGYETINHTCSIDNCNAECEDNSDCNDTECDGLNRCYDGTYRDYSDIPNTCAESCLCTDNLCNDNYVNIITDIDKDGYDIECDSDCNDTNYNTHPGATEICDGQDNDCDGIIPPNEIDGDGDGYLPCQGDCDDADPSTYPGANEGCNGKDNNCNGIPDDLTPPVTTKEYGLPFYDNQVNHWINSFTPITLNSTDSQGPNEECASDNVQTYYRTCLKQGCYQTGLPCNCDGTDWQVYDDSFNILGDSEHCIQFYSEDALKNNETTKSQCVYVDNQAPIPNKTVGDIKTKWNGNDSVFYPEETEHCWAAENGIECWKVTTDTPIYLDCNDPMPHPVNHEKTCFMVGLDGDDATLEYCDILGGSMNEEGWCCGFDAPYTFNFREESEHNLKYYCEDALGNIGAIDDEKFKVFGRMFPIELDKKWNLISVPFDPLNKNPEEVFSEVEENINSVWTYDGGTDKWYVYRPGENITNSLIEVKSGDGYWVLATNEDDFFVGGSLFTPGPTLPPSKNLQPGWNLIGRYGLDEDQTAYCALFSLVDTTIGYPRWSSLVGYNSNTMQFISLDQSDNTNPGEGYWIEMDVQERYSPSTICPGYY